ncbi:MAG: energy-coupling factor transporter transmembrane protein EcfT [Lachnospiraceae bacterium]|nr:energy-coupling factor transporter transmembrane protein EcfT [Lachnospiraceae bacterium]
MNESVRERIMDVSFHGTARLDPRLKLVMLIVLGCVSFFINGDIPEMMLMIAVSVFVCAGSAPNWGIKMLIIYILISFLNTRLKYVSVPVASLMMSMFGVTLLKVIPIVTLGKWVLKSTYMDELTVALERARMPLTVIIPFVVMFRYIPTLGIEYKMIRNTMKIRGVSDTVFKVLFHPFSTIEYILIPLLMRCLKVSDELAASGTTRGMERVNERHCLLKIEFGIGEYVTAFCLGVYIVFLLIMDRTGVGQYVLWSGR